MASEHSGHRQRLIRKMQEGEICEHEYLEILLFNAMPRRNTNEIAHRLLARFGSVKAVLRASLLSLCEVEGVGESLAAYLHCIGKFMQSFTGGEYGERETFTYRMPTKYEYDSFLAYMKQEYGALPYEKFDLYFLDGEGNICDRQYFSRGEQGRVVIKPDELFAAIAAKNPSGIVIVHNHPRGGCQPSEADNLTTRRCQMYCSMNNVLFCDHLIYANDGVFSYYKSGRLEQISQEYSVSKIDGK